VLSLDLKVSGVASLFLNPPSSPPRFKPQPSSSPSVKPPPQQPSHHQTVVVSPATTGYEEECICEISLLPPVNEDFGHTLEFALLLLVVIESGGGEIIRTMVVAQWVNGGWPVRRQKDCNYSVKKKVPNRLKPVLECYHHILYMHHLD
nr:hypothetical protein [Tanacetum cinerariifolium]